MKFKALRNFKSREFDGTQYVKGMVYTIRAESEKKRAGKGLKTLSEMSKQWLNAKLFKANENLEMMGMKIPKGEISYCIDDSFKDVVESWVMTGKAEFVDGALITLGFDQTTSGITGG